EIFEKSNWPDPVTAEVLRYFLVSTHYRSPIDFSNEALETAKAGLDKFYILFQKLDEVKITKGTRDAQLKKSMKVFASSFEKAMDDDFNTALAISEMQRLRSAVNTVLDKGLSKSLSASVLKLFRKYGSILGLFTLSTAQWNSIAGAGEFKTSSSNGRESDGGVPPSLSPADIERLIQERNEARQTKDWERADAVRKQLSDAGIILEDRPDGTTRWRR
ncbi:MAG TPA: DALR domain-containing protein, partial [Nitrospiria bacterium]|nr:DALR domain-containing protein [Nitrospiria bacterium]